MEDRRTILIVDDVPMFRELESVFVARCGRVITAESGEEGLAAVERQLPDVVLLDFSLPDMDGESFCRRVLSDPETAHTIIIAITSGGDPGDHERAIRAGAVDVLSKPLSRSTLVGTVARFTRDGPARGLPRIELYAPVQIETVNGVPRPTRAIEGSLRNLSRGGVFVVTKQALDADSEVELSFRLPETEREVTSRVAVVWARESDEFQSAGFGGRFLDLDRELAHFLDDYVHERGGRPDRVPTNHRVPVEVAS